MVGRVKEKTKSKKYSGQDTGLYRHIMNVHAQVSNIKN